MKPKVTTVTTKRMELHVSTWDLLRLLQRCKEIPRRALPSFSVIADGAVAGHEQEMVVVCWDEESETHHEAPVLTLPGGREGAEVLREAAEGALKAPSVPQDASEAGGAAPDAAGDAEGF